MPDRDARDAVGLALLVRTGKATPRELVEDAIARIERVNGQLNAVTLKLYDEARKAAAATLPDGPFRGVPILIKDLGAGVAGARQTEGCQFFSQQIADHDSTLVARYRRAGFIIVGKTNTPEFGLAPVTEPRLTGPTHNPWKLGITPGGSSGGSAAAVASSMVPVAHGGDGGGSLRMPASCCGVFALKPSRGRNPPGPDRSEVWHGFAVEHVLSLSVRDSAAILDVTAGPEPGTIHSAPTPERPFAEETRIAPGPLRIALTKTPHMPATVHPDCAAAADDAATLLRSLGHQIEEIDVNREIGIEPRAFAADFFHMVCIDVAAMIDEGSRVLGRKANASEFETATWLCGLLGRQHSSVATMKARARLQTIGRNLARFFERHDAILSPTLALPPVAHGAFAPRGVDALVQNFIARTSFGALLKLPGVVDKTLDQVFAFMPFTPLGNVAGLPSMSVPLYWNAAGLPIGTMLTGRFGDEATLFRLAAQLEQARPWSDKKPAVSA